MTPNRPRPSNNKPLPPAAHPRFRFAAIAIAVAVTAALAGCPGGPMNLPLSGAIFSLEVTDARAGSTGKLRITLGDPVGSATAVALASSDPTVAAVPATAMIPGGSDKVEVAYNGEAPGSATITATLNGSQASDVVRVSVHRQLSSLAGPLLPVQVGAAATVQTSLNLRTSEDVVVSLESSDPAVLSLPDSVTVAAFAQMAAFPIAPLAAGGATITAEAGGVTRTLAVNVVDEPALQFLTATARQQVGAITLLSVSLGAITASDQVVGLSSTNPSVLSPPDTLTILAGTSSAATLVTAAATGATSLKAILGDQALSSSVTVVAAPTITGVTLTERVQSGLALPILVTLDAVPALEATINLATSDASVLAVPPAATVAPGLTSAIVPVTAGAAGQAVVTATLGGSSRSATLVVVSEPVITFISAAPGGARFQVGVAGLVNLSLDAAAAGDLTATFSSNNPGVATVAATGVVPTGTLTAAAAFESHAAGFVTLSGSVLGSTRGLLLEFVTAPSMSSFSFNSTPRVGHATGLNVNLDCVVAVDTTVTLTQTNAAALSIPATAVVPAGRSNIAVNAIGLAGMATTVTASLNGTSAMATTTPTP